MKKNNVRLIDIAEKLNLSKVSISKALRDHSDIGDETKKRVKKVAKEMGYRPNLVARSLTSKKSQIIGVIIPKISHYFFAPVVEGIINSASKSNYEIILGLSLENEKMEVELLESMIDLRVDGLLVSITEQTKNLKHFKKCKEMGIEIVFFDRGFSDSGFSYVRVDDRMSAKKGVEHLIDQGIENIGHLAGYSSVEIGMDRKRGYLEALEEASIGMPAESIVEGGFSEKDGYDGFGQLIDQYGIPKALFAVTYPVGLGALRYMKDNDIDSKTVNILTFGASEFNKYLENPFVCIDQPTSKLGQRAFEKILAEIKEDTKRGPEIIQLPSALTA